MWKRSNMSLVGQWEERGRDTERGRERRPRRSLKITSDYFACVYANTTGNLDEMDNFWKIQFTKIHSSGNRII